MASKRTPRSHRDKSAPTRAPKPKPPVAAPAGEETESQIPGSERLQKFLAAAGVGSRRACEELILEGRVTVDGRTVRELGTVVRPDVQEVCFDGTVIQPEKKVYWWINKPPGVISTSHDPQNRKTVLDMVPHLGERIYAVGRLDEESTGLMLLTNDGAVAEKLTHPRYQVPKTYECLIAGKISAETMTKLKEGVWLSDGKARVKQIERLGIQGQASRVRLVLCEGHNREIRRLFAKFGHKVMKLARIGIGPLKIRKLKIGQSRPATPEEVEILQSLAQRVARGPRKTAASAPPKPSGRPAAGKPRPPGKPRPSSIKRAPKKGPAPRGKRRPAR